MGWKEKCYQELTREGLFENAGHRARFRELIDCYSHYPFFNKGLCKCMYLSAWDEEHFVILLETLMGMAAGREKNTRDMEERGDELLKAHTDAEHYVYLLSCAFLENKPYTMPEEGKIPAETAHIIRQALRAAEVIERA